MASNKFKRPAAPRFKKHLRAAYRSGLEAAVALALATAKIEAEFETVKVPYTQPAKHRHYTPDFILPNGIVIETKGLFVVEDRQKHVLVKEQHPNLDIRFVFSNANGKLRKGSPTTYADWCSNNGFKYANKTIPKEWLTEPLKLSRKAAVDALRQG